MAEYIKKDELLAELWKKYCAGCDFRHAGFSHLCLGFNVCECSKCGISEAFDIIDECQTVYKEPQPDEAARKISEILPQDEILAQIAEEHAEAAQAALKLRRAIDKTNPTPKTLQECWESLKEEIGDVLNCIDALNDGDPRRYAAFMSECRELSYRKKARWLGRLEGRALDESKETAENRNEDVQRP